MIFLCKMGDFVGSTNVHFQGVKVDVLVKADHMGKWRLSPRSGNSSVLQLKLRSMYDELTHN